MNVNDAAEESRSANTREYESEHICDTCIISPQACGKTPLCCWNELMEQVADDKVKAAKEDRDDN
ncbi:MAG: hypothetical protein M0Q91_18750 [Methanoregula sp.]|jgi:hypothetical protein|nr:hypothetical protein [Methanoregula sp.]